MCGVYIINMLTKLTTNACITAKLIGKFFGIAHLKTKNQYHHVSNCKYNLYFLLNASLHLMESMVCQYLCTS